MHYEDPNFLSFLETCPKDRYEWSIVGVPSCLEFIEEDIGSIIGHLLLEDPKEVEGYSEF